MTLFVAEILGRGIAVFEALNFDTAQVRLQDESFRRDLIVLQNQGRPLWDGESEIQARDAFPEEELLWTSATIEDDGVHFVFLLPVVDPSRFNDDDDSNDDDHDYGD